MSIKVLIKHSCGGIPLEVEGELNEVQQVVLAGNAMNELYKVARKWQTVINKRQERRVRKAHKPLPLGPMRYGKELFKLK